MVKPNIKGHLVKTKIANTGHIENRESDLKLNKFLGEKEILQDPTVRKIVPYRLAGQTIKWVEWENKCVVPIDLDGQFQSFSQLVCAGSNAIDIGAHSGDTAVAIAAATRGGTTYAYEPHPKTYHILSLQAKLNSKLNLKLFNIALMKDGRDKMWWHGDGDGCNGGIQKTSCGNYSSQCSEIKSENVATHFNRTAKEFLKRLSFIKVDTEGNDRHILRGLKDSVLKIKRPLILIEWYIKFKGCNKRSKDMFRAIREIGYKPYGFSFKLRSSNIKIATCHHYFADLLLLPNEVDINVNGLKICPH